MVIVKAFGHLYSFYSADGLVGLVLAYGRVRGGRHTVTALQRLCTVYGRNHINVKCQDI